MNVTSVYERYKARQPVRIAAVTLYLGVAAVYLVWRATVLNPEQLLFSLALYGAELSVFCLALTSFFLTWKVRVRDPIPAPPGLEVDVLIPTYNESVEMLRLTVQAALEIEYPHETWLLDDGRRPEMRALADELGCRSELIVVDGASCDE